MVYFLLCSTSYMRLFVALDIEGKIRAGIHGFMQEMAPLAPNVRWVNPESLHVTLKFMGEQPEPKVKEIESALTSICASPFQLGFHGSGFFPTPRSARVFWIGIESGPELAQLAGAIDAALSQLGIEKEKRAFSAHLTLARAKGGSGAPSRQKSDRSNRHFEAVQKKLASTASAEFGTMTAREFFLYRSQLSRHGSRYSKIARFPLAAREA
ncbi:MAG: RNA 2',3'-cyclic phosphodiesterase [Acidobacteria bacterium]|nr:MAG: RNA 2',3'-cyclic phosphodiesterase [Acidobacteriota bacterium]